MGGLAHYLEEEGLATTQISLIRIHTEVIKPPRALWVPFELGRPLGPPDNPAFQRRVLLAALQLLEAPSGPVLRDFPEDEPPGAVGTAQPACPVDFTPEAEASAGEETLAQAFIREMALLRPWYDLALEKRGRTTARSSGLAPEEAAKYLCSFLADQATPNPRPEIPCATMLKLAAEDVKAYYFESLTVQPGPTPDSQALADWFWGETRAGELMAALREACQLSDEKDLQLLGKLLLVPRSQVHRFTGRSWQAS